MSTNGKLYFGGMSTDIEIKALMDQFGESEPGTLVTHEEIEAAIGCERSSNRYRGVVARWKRIMFAKNNIELAARAGEGYTVMTATERIQRATSDTHRINTKLRRVHYRFAAIPRNQLTGPDAKRADHSQMVIAKLCDDMASARKQIEPPSRPSRLTA